MQVHKADRDGIKRAGVGAFTLEQKPGERNEAWLRTNACVVKIKDQCYDYNVKATVPMSIEVYYDGERIPTTAVFHTENIHKMTIQDGSGPCVPSVEMKGTGEISLSQMIKQEAERLAAS